FYECGGVAVGLQQSRDLIVAGATEHRRAADLVAIEVEDRQHRAVAGRVEEARALPGAGQRAALSLAGANHRGDDQGPIVACRSERMGQHIAQLSALVDRPRSLHADVAWDPARRGETAAQAAQPTEVLADVGVDLAVGPLEVGKTDQSRTAMTRTREVDHVDA